MCETHRFCQVLAFLFIEYDISKNDFPGKNPLGQSVQIHTYIKKQVELFDHDVEVINHLIDDKSC